VHVRRCPVLIKTAHRGSLRPETAHLPKWHSPYEFAMEGCYGRVGLGMGKGTSVRSGTEGGGVHVGM
jgi:hypothetical protein